MDAARDRTTKLIVEAEDLKLLDQVDTYGYDCHGFECGAQAFPRSFRSENLLRAHFQVKSAHGADCDVAAEEAIIGRGSKGSVKNELETSPSLSPARLHLVEVREFVDLTLTQTENQTKSTRRLASGSSSKQRPAGRRPANSIRPICRAFLRFPHDRDLSLHIEGIGSNTYQTVFERLLSKGFERFPNQRIFYADLAWTAAEETDQHLIIQLNAGEWTDRQLAHYRVVVQWAGWSKTARSRLRHEMEISRKESMQATKGKKDSRSYLFFIGAQDADAPSIFYVTDQRLICTVHDELR